jgi:hypothetical protein
VVAAAVAVVVVVVEMIETDKSLLWFDLFELCGCAPVFPVLVVAGVASVPAE